MEEGATRSSHEARGAEGGNCMGDVSGETLDKGMVDAAREEDLQKYMKHTVFNIVVLPQCRDEVGKAPIGARWVDTDKRG